MPLLPAGCRRSQVVSSALPLLLPRLNHPKPYMRILIVYNTAMEHRSISGVQRHFAGVVPHWIRGGHQVDFLIGRAAFPLWRSMFPDSHLISSDNFIGAPRTPSQAWLCLPAYAWRMFPFHYAREASGYDLYYACAPFIYEVYPALRLARKNKARLAVKAHHMVSGLDQRRSLFDRFYLQSEKWSLRLLNRYADVILAGAPPVAEQYRQLESAMGLSPRRVAPTGYGIDLDTIPLSIDHPKEFDAVLLGRLHPHKGIFDAPPIWKRVCAAKPDARLLIVGEGTHRSDLAAQFDQLGLSKNVLFTGAINDAEKNDLLARSRVGLSLSREEGWGLSITEFLAAGLPVVAMHLPIFDHVFPDQLDLVPPAAIEPCAERILWWTRQPEACRAAGIAGRKFVEQYDYRSVAERELEALMSDG